MDGNVIKSFLVGLGFGVDDGDLAKFNKAIASASLKVAALYTAVKVSAAGIFLGISKISEGFEQLGYEYRIISPLINKTLMLRQAMLSAFRAAGIDIKQAVQQSVLFNFSLTKTKYALEAIYKSVGLKFLPILTKQMDIFRKQIYANMPKIQNALEKFVTFVFKAFEATTILGGRLWSILGRVYDFFKMLDKATSGWSTVILGVVAAWKFLNLSFLATPLGMIIAGFTALLALWDDFQTFKEGGKSLINWGPIIPFIDDLVEAFKPLIAMVSNLVQALWKLFHMDFAGAFGSLKAAGQGLLDLFTNLWGAIKQIGSALGDLIGSKIKGLVESLSKGVSLNLFGGDDKSKDGSKGVGGAMAAMGKNVMDFMSGNPNIGKNVAPENNPAVAKLANPIGSSIQNNSSKQSVSQETNIIVQGSADANSTSKAVAGEQNKVNFDMARNMKGATR